MNAFRQAVQFLTVIPFPLTLSSRPGTAEGMEVGLARAMAFFPAVGFLMGLVSLSAFMAVQPFLPERVAVFLLLVMPVALSGGLHIDGFGDFCDGFFGGRNREDALRIMKDPRMGAWGVLGIGLLVLVKYELLCALQARAGFFLLAMALSRWSQVVLSFVMPYAGLGTGISQAVAGKVSAREAAIATAFALPAVLWQGSAGVVIFAGLVVFLAGLSVWFKKKIGGVTGDVLGASSEMTEIFVLFLGLILGAA